MPALPLDVDFTTPQSSNTTFACSVNVKTAVTQDTTYQLYCTNTSLVTAAGGGAFPTSITILSGHTSASVNLHTGSVTTATNVTIAAGAVGADMSNPANWQASRVLTINP